MICLFSEPKEFPSSCSNFSFDPHKSKFLYLFSELKHLMLQSLQINITQVQEAKANYTYWRVIDSNKNVY